MSRPVFIRVTNAAFLASLLLSACGDEASFKGLESKKKPATSTPAATPAGAEVAEANPSINVAPTSGGKLFWMWGCGSDTKPVQLANGDVKISGKGKHKIQRSEGGFPVRVSGQICQPTSGIRDVLFIVDTSGSMGGLTGADRRSRTGECGRKQAVDTVIGSMPADGKARVGIVTFSNGLVQKSGGFLAPSEAQSRFGTADTLCANSGETNYQKPLEEAIKYFSTARADAAREIYFVSDGKPSGDGINGRAEARALREKYGVTIVTMMIKGDDSILKDAIASRDVNDQPLHTKVANAEGLAEAMVKLSQRNITGGALRLRAIGAPQWQERNLLEVMQNGQFEWDVASFNTQDFPYGLEFQLDYWDENNRHYGGSGNITWQ